MFLQVHSPGQTLGGGCSEPAHNLPPPPAIYMPLGGADVEQKADQRKLCQEVTKNSREHRARGGQGGPSKPGGQRTQRAESRVGGHAGLSLCLPALPFLPMGHRPLWNRAEHSLIVASGQEGGGTPRGRSTPSLGMGQSRAWSGTVSPRLEGT